MSSNMANRENSQMRKFYFDSTISFSACQNLLCLASLIEDFLGDEEYDFVLTPRFRSDPLERRFQQMSGGRFLVVLRDVTSSDRIIEIKSLLKEDLDIDNVKVDNTNNDEITNRLLSHTDICVLFSRTSFSIR